MVTKIVVGSAVILVLAVLGTAGTMYLNESIAVPTLGEPVPPAQPVPVAQPVAPPPPVPPAAVAPPVSREAPTQAAPPVTTVPPVVASPPPLPPLEAEDIARMVAIPAPVEPLPLHGLNGAPR